MVEGEYVENLGCFSGANLWVKPAAEETLWRSFVQMGAGSGGDSGKIPATKVVVRL